MKLIESTLNGVLLIEPKVFGDHRGYFTESYNKVAHEKMGIDLNLVQDNQSFSAQAGTIRGLHYQRNPKAQTKIVRVLTGAIFDVAVDIRRESPTFGQWYSAILTADNFRQLVIPQGFAHGFCTLVDNTTVMYKVDEFYSPEHDAGIIWSDAELGIPWPTSSPVLSDKDLQLPLLKDAVINF